MSAGEVLCKHYIDRCLSVCSVYLDSKGFQIDNWTLIWHTRVRSMWNQCRSWGLWFWVLIRYNCSAGLNVITKPTCLSLPHEGYMEFCCALFYLTISYITGTDGKATPIINIPYVYSENLSCNTAKQRTTKLYILHRRYEGICAQSS